MKKAFLIVSFGTTYPGTRGVVSGCADRGSGVEYNCSKSNADA